MSNQQPDDEEIREGYESHELRKWLDRMADSADVPDHIGFIIAPTKQFAVLLSNICGGRIHVVCEVTDDGETQYVEFEPNGSYFATYSEDTLIEDTVLDLRLHS